MILLEGWQSWSIAPVLKIGGAVKRPGVRIPLLPPLKTIMDEIIAYKFQKMTAGEVFVLERNHILSILLPYLTDGTFTNPRLFGSVAKGNSTEMSDIDILLAKGKNWTPSRHLSLLGDFVDFGFPIQITIEDNLWFTPDKTIAL